MVVLGRNPEWRAVSWLGPEPVNRSRTFRESWLSSAADVQDAGADSPVDAHAS